MIAALFVETNGCYYNLPGVDPWDVVRDARKYSGPYPVVAHPPCQLWGRFAQINFNRWGGEHNRPGNDGGCFAFALASIRKYGGVLEHPADSYAWKAFNLPKPTGRYWQHCGGDEWTCEVCQVAYGHKARKRTWLYLSSHLPPPNLSCECPKGTHQIGKDHRMCFEKPKLQRADASSTPTLFRDKLIYLARLSEDR